MNLELGTTLEWVSTGVGYSVGVSWVGKRDISVAGCSRMNSEQNGCMRGCWKGRVEAR